MGVDAVANAKGPKSPSELPSNWKLTRWMAGLALAYPWRCLLLLTLHLLLLALQVSGLRLTGVTFDFLAHQVKTDGPLPRWPLGLQPPPGWSAQQVVLALGAAIIILAVLRVTLRYAAAMATGHLVNAILTHLRVRVYDQLQRLSFRFFDQHETGSIINRATSDASGVATFAEFALIQIVMLGVSLAVYFVFMLRINPLLSVVALITTPVLAIVSVLYSKKVRPAYERDRKLYDELILTLAENIQGQHVVKGFALEAQQIARFHAANDAVREQKRWLFPRASLYHVFVGGLSQLNLVLVLLAGGYIVIQHHGELHPPLTVGDLLIFAGALRVFSGQVEAISNIANTLQASQTAAGRVYEVLATKREIDTKANAVPLKRARGAVAFEHVYFGYQAGRGVLEDLTFTIAPGKCVAILGETGSGKSTLLSLLPRFYDPTAGRITLDGHDLRDLNLTDLRRNIGVVFQESFLFSNTVHANIAFGHPQASREMVERAAKIAQAHDFIMELAQGYDTIIGEQGSTLSGGQRQRLALARAILLEPPILLLDDATAAIDPETEHEIMGALDAAMAGRTTIVVAHRLSTLRRADLVLVLDHGRIVQQGTHAQLVGRDGHYADVAKLQVADEESRWILQAARWDNGEVDTPLLELGHKGDDA